MTENDWLRWLSGVTGTGEYVSGTNPLDVFAPTKD